MLKLLNSVLLVVILCERIQSIKGESLQCQFQDVGFVWGSMYTCRVSSLDNSNNDMNIKSHTGTHLANRNDNDVKAIRIESTNTKYIPEGLGSLFSLTAFLVQSSQLIEIRSKNFQGMQNLEYLSLISNKLTSLSSDTFSTLTKLKLIWLDSNQIKYIGSGVFDQLKNLNRVDLNGNICVNKDYEGATAITEMKHDIKENCITSTEVTVVQMENKMINEFNSLNEMMKQLLIESKEHQIEQQENINLRAELSAAKDLLMKANDQQKTSKDEQKTEQEANTKVITERDQLKKELSKAKETIEDFYMEVMDLKIERHNERQNSIGLRSKLMEANEQLAECQINERISC